MAHYRAMRIPCQDQFLPRSRCRCGKYEVRTACQSRVGVQRVTLRHFSKRPPPNPTCDFHRMKLSRRLEVQERLTTPPPTRSFTALAASRVRKVSLPIHLPAPYRPVSSVTVSLDGRHSIDYCEGLPHHRARAP
jgi:hypothetical protein